MSITQVTPIVFEGNLIGLQAVIGEESIGVPIAKGNRFYQDVLDHIIEHGGACFESGVPDVIQAAADEKQFNQQLAAYRVAVARLAQYRLADGRPEVREMQPTGEQVFNEETMQFEDVMQEVIVQTAIDPLEPTVEITVYDETDPMAEPTVQTVANPEIVADDAERAAAQAVVDNTPDEVKEF